MLTKNQMALDFPINTDFSAENFMETTGNRTALETIKNLNGGGEVAVIYGGEGCGKSHLTALWQEQVNAISVDDIELLSADITHIYAEDLHARSKAQQEALFHAFNHIKSVNGSLLVTSQAPTAQLGILADLKSRLLLGTQVEIELPTPQELAMLLAKWAWDRHLELSPEVVQYLLKRSERSPKMLEQSVAKLDKLSLEQKRKITIPLAREALLENSQIG
jgi:DnaA regulatory inactivator Hda